MDSRVKEKIMFLNIDDVVELTHWSKKKVQELFNRDDFPSCDFGKEKIAEANAVIKYFSVPRRKKDDEMCIEKSE